MMKIFLQWFVVLIMLAIIFIYVAGEASEKQTQRIYARAHLVEAQSESRKDMMTVLMPYTILGLTAIGGVIAIIVLTYGLITITTIWLNRPLPPRTETHILERQVIVMLQDGQTSRDFYKQLGQGDRVKLLK